MQLQYQVNKMIIVPTILEKDFSLAEIKINLVKVKTRWIQIDVIDGFFSSGKSFELELLTKIDKEIQNNLLDIHLMVKEPIKWIEKCNFVGASRIIGQVEMMDDKQTFIKEIKNMGLEAGLAFEVETKVEEIPEETDLILLMGRKAGFEVANFEEKVYKKIEKLVEFRKKEKMDFEIGVDGGVSEKIIEKIKKIGVEIAYCGGAIFSGNVNDNWKKLNYVSSN
jgi:ribulose-phosphate 3-epimerase